MLGVDLSLVFQASLKLQLELVLGTWQVEYYLSDENLKYDKFFHDKISANADGWLDARPSI